MYSPNTPLDRFATGSLDTVSGPRLIVMCYERVERDLTTALEAIASGDIYEVNHALGHAQDLIAEMAALVDPEAWEHSGSLLALYDYLLRVLAVGNVRKDAALIGEARTIVRDLGEAWSGAARTADAGPAAAPTFDRADGPDDSSSRTTFSVQA